jgi:hypothetical protein
LHAQEVTAHERARWWASLLLRPGASLVVYRVGVVDAALLAVERKDMAAVLDDSTEPGSRLQVRPFTHTAAARVERRGRLLLPLSGRRATRSASCIKR